MWIAEGEKDLKDKRAIWDWIKFNIRSHAIHYSEIKSRQKRETETRLQNEFSEAARKFEDDPSEDHKSRLVELKEKLELIRAKARWYENQVKEHIRKLQINDSLTTNPSVILLEAKHFYMNDEDRDILIDNFFNNLEISKLLHNEKQSCERNISLEEWEVILNSFKEKKWPGSDGIPI